MWVIHPAGEGDVTCRRCKQDGTFDSKGEFLYIKARLGFGATGYTMKCRYRSVNEVDFSEWFILLTPDSEGSTFSGVVEGVVLGKSAYIVQISAENGSKEIDGIERRIPYTTTPFHLGKGGKNVAIGQRCDYSHEDAFDIGFKTYFNGGIGVKTIFEGIKWTPDPDEMWGVLLSEVTENADITGIGTYTLFFVLFEDLHAEVCVYWGGGICGPSVIMIADDDNLSLIESAGTITHMYAIL